MIDFDKLVLGPAMDVFARPISVNPLASQPGQPAYALQRDGVSPLRGVFERKNIDIALEEGIMSSAVLSLGIRLSEYLVSPKPGDKLTIPACQSLPALGVFTVDDTDEDSEGGSTLTLKRDSQ